VISLSPQREAPLGDLQTSDDDEAREVEVAGDEDLENHNQASANEAPSTPGAGIWSTVGTPAKTPKKDVTSNVLQGAVVFVDVHTTEGADASGIFVELLTQMGARCVKQWSWNPRASFNVPTDQHLDGTPAGKIGITHVVYKDGGVRTLEKVRDSKGVVLCVGVNWVLEYVFPLHWH